MWGFERWYSLRDKYETMEAMPAEIFLHEPTGYVYVTVHVLCRCTVFWGQSSMPSCQQTRRAVVSGRLETARSSWSLLRVRTLSQHCVVYSDATQLNSTRRRVELSCVAINGPLGGKCTVSLSQSVQRRSPRRLQKQFQCCLLWSQTLWILLRVRSLWLYYIWLKFS